MNSYLIREDGNDNIKAYRITAESPEKAIEIIKGYGQYRKNVWHSIFLVTIEEFDTMFREDYSYVDTF